MSVLWARVRHAIPASRVVGALLVLAGAAVIAVPLPASGCPAPVVSYMRTSLTAVHDVAAPQESAELTSARSIRDDAQLAVNAIDEIDAKVSAAKDAADTASGKATDAESAASQAQYDVSYSSDSDPAMAQYSVDSAQSSVDMYKGLLQDAKDAAATAQDDGYYDSSYQDSIDSTQAELDQSNKDLAAAKAGLTAAQGAAAKQQSEQQSKDATAKALRTKADGLQAAASKAAADAADMRSAAESELSSAESDVADLEANHQAEVNSWTHAHIVKVGQVRALNAEAADCRTLDRRNGASGAAVLFTGLLLLLPLGSLSRLRVRRPWRR